jgi:hypothetical protein
MIAFESWAKDCQTFPMTFLDIKKQIPSLTPEERLELSHLLLDIELQQDPEYHAEMERRMKAMDAGRKVTQEEVERRHKELLAQGR